MVSELQQFHDLAHIFVSLIGGLLLLAIYFNIRSRFRVILEESNVPKRVDKGLLYLSLSLFVWVLSGLLSYVGSTLNVVNSVGYVGLENLLSIINNMFILLALSFFYYAPSFIYKNDKNVKIIISIIVLTSVCSFTLSNIYGNNVFNGIKLASIPDLILSVFLSYLLLFSFYKTFIYRGLKFIALLSSMIIILVFASQLPSTFDFLENELLNGIVKLIAKTSLISLFLVLATTWVIQLANIPKVKEIQLKILDWSSINLHIPSKDISNLQIDFGSKTTQFKNLLKFAIRRKWGEGDYQSITIGMRGEIKNQSYITRILENINELGALDDEQKLDRRDLFVFLGEGKYRLRILPEHITIDHNLITEFLKQKENERYSFLVKF